ncbi:MAG: hypothetical protein ABR499_04820 [Gemmatimonadaceae bacterium]
MTVPILTLTNLPPRGALARLTRLILAAAFAVGGAGGCTRDGEGSTPDGREAGRSADSADGALGLPTRKVPPYRVAQVASPGTIRGTIDASGIPTATQPACGAATQAAGSVVWLDDIRTGLDVPAERKLDRRLELAAGRCRLEPRLQLALVGSTLNVRNDESVAHQIELFRDGAPQPIYRIPFIFAGQLVPAQRPLSVPGVVEARSTQDPSLRSLVVIVDHPYAAVVGADGRFVIDSIPPGRYKLMAMTPNGAAEQTVEVPASGEQTVSLRLTPR